MELLIKEQLFGMSSMFIFIRYYFIFIGSKLKKLKASGSENCAFFMSLCFGSIR